MLNSCLQTVSKILTMRIEDLGPEFPPSFVANENGQPPEWLHAP